MVDIFKLGRHFGSLAIDLSKIDSLWVQLGSTDPDYELNWRFALNNIHVVANFILDVNSNRYSVPSEHDRHTLQAPYWTVLFWPKSALNCQMTEEAARVMLQINTGLRQKGYFVTKNQRMFGQFVADVYEILGINRVSLNFDLPNCPLIDDVAQYINDEMADRCRALNKLREPVESVNDGSHTRAC